MISNVLVDVPKQGDIVVIDSNKEYQYIALESFAKADLPSDWQIAAEVYDVRGEDVRARHPSVADRRWADVFLWKIYNYDLDGADHAVTLTINKVAASVTYNATDLDTLASQLNAVVSATDFGGHNYTVYARDGVLTLQHNTYTTYLAVTATGVSVTQNVAPELEASYIMLRRNGQRSGEGAVVNPHRSLIYYMQDLSSTTYNPASDVTSLQRTYPICLPAYLGTSKHQSDHCALLREHYGEGTDGWLRFMEDMGIVCPWEGGIMMQSGKENTYKLAGQTYTAADGTQKALYPAFDFCAEKEYDCDGMRLGDWYMTDFDEVNSLVGPVTYPAIYDRESGTSKSVAIADADVLTRGASAIGATIIGNNNYVWSSCRYNADNAWCFYGNYGFAYGSYFCNSYLAVPSVLLKVKGAKATFSN